MTHCQQINNSFFSEHIKILLRWSVSGIKVYIIHIYTGWVDQSWTAFCRSATAAIGGCVEKYLQKLTGGSPSKGISWGWGWADPLGPMRLLATKSTSELCTGLQHSKIWEDVSNSKKLFLMWKSCEMMASTSRMAKGWKEAMRVDLAADLGLFCRWWQVFCQRTCQCRLIPRVFEATCGPPGPKDVSWWKIHLTADSAPAYTTKTAQWLWAEFWIPAYWPPYFLGLNSLVFSFLQHFESLFYTTRQSGHPTYCMSFAVEWD